MSARQRYPAPHQQLLLLAREARREGLTFAEFWDRAVPEPEPGSDRLPPLPRVDAEDPPAGAVLWPRDTYDRKVAYRAVVSCKTCWQRAYDGEPPTQSEAALRILAPLLRGLEAAGNATGAALPSAA